MRKRMKPEAESGAWSAPRSEWIIILLLVAASSCMILTNLSHSYLWGDEAQTALISQTILTHGVPLGFDGKNYFSVETGDEFGKGYLWRWHPWLPFYVLAGFFAVLGKSTLTARLPFALFGIATVLMVYLLGKSLWESRRAAMLSALFMLASVPMLLLFRQCRYYSMVTFFSMAGLYAYMQMVRDREYSGAFFIASAFLLFHSLYVYSAALMATVLIHSAIYHRRHFRRLLLMSGIVVAVNIPWIIFFSSVAKAHHVLSGTGAWMLKMLVFSLKQTALYVLPPVILAVLIGIVLITFRVRHARFSDVASRERWSLLLIFALVTIAVLLPIAGGQYLRYLAPVIPAACLLLGLLLHIAARLHIVLCPVVILAFAWQMNMRDYVTELRDKFVGPVEGIAGYLNEHSKPGDVVITSHDPLPLMFYTNLRIVSGAAGEDMSSVKSPRWVILRRYYCKVEAPSRAYIVRFLNEHQYEYEAIYLDAPDTLNQNRENPEDHYFTTPFGEEPVVIHKRMD